MHILGKVSDKVLDFTDEAVVQCYVLVSLRKVVNDSDIQVIVNKL